VGQGRSSGDNLRVQAAEQEGLTPQVYFPPAFHPTTSVPMAVMPITDMRVGMCNRIVLVGMGVPKRFI
jgi:hypothetical protein